MMQRIIQYLRHRRDASLLGAAFILLVFAYFQPTIPLKRNIYSYLLVVDISQSMNVIDTTIHNKPTSRIAYTQHLLHEMVASMPCGSRVSIGLYAGVSIAALFTPIEVCANFAVINDSIDHLDWRAAWSGNSRMRESLFTLARVLRAFPEPAQVVYFTDGEEAPKLHAFNTKDLTSFQSAGGWLFVGIGSEKGAPIPKLDSKNQVIGYWSNDSFAMQPGIAQISESNLGVRDNNVASGAGDTFISRLNEDYMIDVAKQISGDYVRGDSLQKVLTAMKAQTPAKRDTAPYAINWLLAIIAGLLVIAAYLPKHPMQQFKQYLSGLKTRKT